MIRKEELSFFNTLFRYIHLQSIVNNYLEINCLYSGCYDLALYYKVESNNKLNSSVNDGSEHDKGESKEPDYDKDKDQLEEQREDEAVR
jgi:hypothetical protein